MNEFTINTAGSNAFAVDAGGSAKNAPIKKDPTHFVIQLGSGEPTFHDPIGRYTEGRIIASGSLADCVLASSAWVEQHGGKVKIAGVQGTVAAKAEMR